MHKRKQKFLSGFVGFRVCSSMMLGKKQAQELRGMDGAVLLPHAPCVQCRSFGCFHGRGFILNHRQEVQAFRMGWWERGWE